MKVYSNTDIGRVRTANQDAFFTAEMPNGTVVAIVCDGMGGANAGNVASENAAKRIADYIIKAYRQNMTEDDTERLIKSAVQNANIAIYDMALNNPEYRGMGTTAVIAVINSGGAVIAHVGDSRIYLLSDGITQLTRDHSIVQSLIESGKITPEDAKVHPRKNIITRAIGVEEEVTADTSAVSLNPGDTLLLCTDGLTNYLNAEDILNIYKSADIADVPLKLTEKANENGGGDNITVVTVTYTVGKEN